MKKIPKIQTNILSFITRELDKQLNELWYIPTVQSIKSKNNMSSITDVVPPGVVTGDNLLKLLKHARDNKYAIPAVNCTRFVTKFECVHSL